MNNLFIAEFGISVVLSSNHSHTGSTDRPSAFQAIEVVMAPLLDHVGHVVRMGANKEMIRIDT